MEIGCSTLGVTRGTDKLFPSLTGEITIGFFPFPDTELEKLDNGLDDNPVAESGCDIKIGASGDSCLDAFFLKLKLKLESKRRTKLKPTAKSSSISSFLKILKHFCTVPGGG